MRKSLSNKLIHQIYEKICRCHQRHLKKHGVKLPELKNRKGNFTKDALVLIYLSRNYPNTKKASKRELTKFIREYYPDTNDMQQARHLGAQKGWRVLAGGRDNIVRSLKRGEYQLHTLKQPYPNFTCGRRQIKDFKWSDVKKSYSHRCATCGSKEGMPHFHWPAAKTILQKAHKNPELPLTAENTIPQCQKCNRADRNRRVYDDKGRVVRLAAAHVLARCSESVQKKAYKILYKKYKGAPPE